MAVVSTIIHPTAEATWSEEEAKYTYTITYLVDDTTIDSISVPQAAIPGGIPATISLTHYDGTTTVTLKEVERSAQSYKTEGARQSKVMVTYEGHVDTVFSAVPATSTTSSKLIMSLDDPPAGIGPDGEGTTRLLGQTTLTITRVMPHNSPDLWGMLFYVIPTLTGAVNESAWAPTALDDTGYIEGAWLYLGASPTRQRDGSYIIVHEFAATNPEGSTFEQIMYFNFYYLGGVAVATADARQREGREILLPEQHRQIYPVAGVGDIISEFEDLGL